MNELMMMKPEHNGLTYVYSELLQGEDVYWPGGFAAQGP